MDDPRPDVSGPPPDLPPSFLDFPLLRTTLFLAGVDMERTVGEMYRKGNYRYLRGVFNILSVNQYPDTSSTQSIIAASPAEIASAVSIISLVAVLVRMYYTRPGASSDTSLGLGPAVEIPILAAFFTLFALIAAALTWFSMGEVIRTSRLGTFIPFVSPEPEICMVCLESEPLTNLVSLQCYSDEEEAASPQRKPHYFHEACIESWWLTRDNAPRCPVCSQQARGYRTVDGNYRYPAPDPSSLVWATYSFFASVQFFFGSRSPIATRQLPWWQNSLGEHFAVVLLRGVGSLCLIIVSRLFYVKALYACYLFLVNSLNEYPSTRLYEYYLEITFSFFDMVSDLEHQICSLAGLFMPQRQIEYFSYFLEWPKIWFSSLFDLGPAGGWILHVLIVVLSFGFVHGFASRVNDLIYALTPPEIAGHERPDKPRVSVDFLQMIGAPWFEFTESLGWSPDEGSMLLAVTIPPVLWGFCFGLYLFYSTVLLTIWEDFFWQLVAFVLTHTAAKSFLSFWPDEMALGYGATILTGFILLPMVANTISRAWFHLP
ncbi:hypothetical protein FHL15_007051 [Xylaria flabelliformis]|uniref:RING-type domain-containing protein n=1 Tax=Xylaria flabelliformis TaxID=2512241 RepID=A0A553HVI1_9PEZI|nr:hypothetical protein FHL15_007051 [Xylaria flabelliformis]